MIEPALSGSPVPRAFLRIGGITIARQQLALALALKCERIICLAHGLDPALVEVQHAAEAVGARFNVIASPRQLLGLITATDEVFGLADGLFVSAPEAAAVLEQGQAVLVQPIEPGLAAGFERIDHEHAAAGAMRVPGRLVERIAELPADCDALSALQRIALQAGIRQRPIPVPSGRAMFWTLVRSEDEAHTLEPQWIRQRTREDAPLSPARGLALVAVRSLGPALLHAGSGAGVVGVAALVTLVIALGMGWFALPALGLGTCALGWALRETAGLLARIEADEAPRVRRIDARAAYGLATDAVIVALAGWSMAAAPGEGGWTRFFAPVVLVGLLRLLPRALAGRWQAWLEDRSLLAALLAGSALAGVTQPAVQLAVLLLLLAGIALPRGGSSLTRP